MSTPEPTSVPSQTPVSDSASILPEALAGGGTLRRLLRSGELGAAITSTARIAAAMDSARHLDLRHDMRPLWPLKSQEDAA